MITNVIDLLRNTLSKVPQNIAFADDKNSVTFFELYEKAKCIGTYISLLSNNIVRRPIVVFVDRNVESMVSFMGVVCSGNFYVPVDSKSPLQRISLIFDTLDPLAVVVFSAEESRLIREINHKSLIIDYSVAVTNDPDDSVVLSIHDRIIDTDPVYAIFTSGSTGIPKGVVINHRAVIDLVAWLVSTFGFTLNDRLGNQTPFYFDGSVKDIYISLYTGATTYILPKKFFSFPKLLAGFIKEKNITSLLWATSAIKLIGNSDILETGFFRSVNKVFFAGEAMPAKQLNVWRRYMPDAKFVNLYGPTEVTVDSTYYVVEREFNDDEYIPIGRSCRNKEVLVFNDQNKLAGIGEPGELCVRGTGLALGYYNSKEKTSEVFVQNPLHDKYEDKIYKTGDIVKYNEFGELVFISRRDFQIKHMGNRIELGEIEVAVNSIKEITNAACIYDYDTQKIILFYSSFDGREVNIIDKVKEMLPKYMYPGSFINLTQMPLNSSGKTDRLKLNELYSYEKDQ